MKKIILISAMTLIAILFSSCGNQQAKKEAASSENSVSELVKCPFGNGTRVECKQGCANFTDKDGDGYCDNSRVLAKEATITKTGPKSVLIISSSPRRGGNSETLCKQFMKGAIESGNMVEMLNLNDFDIKFFAKTEYVRGEKDSEEDDAIRIIKKMAVADVIVLSSPVYFYSMTAQMKALIDRVYNYEKNLQDKEFYYIITSTDKEREALDGTIMGFRGFLHCLPNAQERGIVYGNGARERGTIDKLPAMKEAYEMGKQI